MNISIVPSRPEFVEFWLKWRTQPSTLRYNPILQLPEEELRENFKKIQSDLSDLKAAPSFMFFACLDSQPVGTLSLKNISPMMGLGELGYGIDEPFHGRGIGTRALRMFVEKIFSETDLRRLFAYIAVDNIPSRRIAEKAGFVLEGVCREHYIINGKPTDEALYGLLKSEFK